MTLRHPPRLPDFPFAARRTAGALALLAGLLAAPSALAAQDSAATAVATAAAAERSLLTRQELQAQAARASGPQAVTLRERLREGDFRVGDKISLRTESSLNLPENLAEVLNSTHTLREGKTLRLPNMPDLSLDGVLRSELDSVVNAHLARSLRSVRAHAEPTLQVLISGPVGKPGYYPAEPDMLVTDVIMAVGPAGNADLRRSVVKRDGKEIVSRDSLQAAIRNGATLDRLDFRSGDELVVGERSTRNWMTYLSVISALSSIGWLVVSLTR